MSEGRKEAGRKGRQPEGGAAGSSRGPSRGGLVSYMGWIVSANVLALLALVLAVVALVFHFTEEAGAGGGPAVAEPTATAQATPTPPIVVEGVSVDDDPSIGPEDAPVTMIGFTDYQ